MVKRDFVLMMDKKLKLVRVEYGFTQDKMAVALGISKKTLVEIEKGRRTLGWTGAVALAAIFRDSQVLSDTFGGELSDMIAAMAFEGLDVTYPKTMGGRIWWKTIIEEGGCKIQQNIISQHYRLLDVENQRLSASFSLDAVKEHLAGLQAGR